eukprot:COSAG02_NODE_56701_length_284_cov_0.827027_2_plen_34_part_01
MGLQGCTPVGQTLAYDERDAAACADLVLDDWSLQ